MSEYKEGIRLVDLKGGDLGVPAPGYVFDGTDPTRSLSRLMKWADQMLELRKSCGGGDVRPVCPVLIVGHSQETMIRSIAKGLPAGVELYDFPGGVKVVSVYKDGAPTTLEMFYLIAP